MTWWMINDVTYDNDVANDNNVTDGKRRGGWMMAWSMMNGVVDDE
jgi:hypothetical protein